MGNKQFLDEGSSNAGSGGHASFLSLFGAISINHQGHHNIIRYSSKFFELPAPLIGEVISYLDRSSVSFFAMYIEHAKDKKEISRNVYNAMLRVIAEEKDNTHNFRSALYHQSEQLRCCMKAYRRSLSRCQHCGLNEMDSSILLYRCSICNVFKYCSKECRSFDWSRKHKYICGNFILDKGLKDDPTGGGCIGDRAQVWRTRVKGGYPLKGRKWNPRDEGSFSAPVNPPMRVGRGEMNVDDSDESDGDLPMEQVD
jgi:hypothetical protein